MRAHIIHTITGLSTYSARNTLESDQTMLLLYGAIALCIWQPKLADSMRTGRGKASSSPNPILYLSLQYPLSCPANIIQLQHRMDDGKGPLIFTMISPIFDHYTYPPTLFGMPSDFK